MKNIQTEKKETLLDYLRNIPGDRLFIVNSQESLTYSEVMAIADIFLSKYDKYKGSNIAVKFESRTLAATYLPAISHLATNLLFIPDGLSNEVETDFLKQAEINYLFHIKKSKIDIELITKSTKISSQKSWILSTSGTTGVPKLIAYDLEKLTGSTKNDIELGKIFNWALTYDINRFAGLQVYFQAIIAGSKLTVLESVKDTEVIEILKTTNVNCISATPSFFRKLVMNPSCKEISFLRITLGGEIADQKILDVLNDHYPLAKISHIYASTETGVGFSVNDKMEGFPLSFLNNTGKGSHSQAILRINNGTLWIKSKNSTNKIISGNLDIDDGFINTGDIVKVTDTRVIFLGRESGAINVGGNKVMPEEVENVVLLHRSVSECRVFGKKNAMMGMLVTCEIILKDPNDDKEIIKKEIVTNCNSKLAPYKVPVIIKFVDEIAKNSVGKIMRGIRS